MNTRLLAISGAVAAAVIGAVGCGSSSSTNSSSSTPNTTTQSTDTGATIDAKALFVNGKASTGAQACGNCHKLAAAGTAGTVGPNLDEIAPDDNAEALTEMINDPNAEIVDGFKKDIMPLDYATKLTTDEIAALATYIDKNSAHAEK